MNVRQRARANNDFEPSAQAIPLDALRTTAEVARLLGVKYSTLRSRAWRWRVATWRGSGHVTYWTPEQVERLRGNS